MRDLTPEVLHEMKTQVMAHPTLPSYSKKTLLGALTKASEGVVPTTGELNLIETAFGKETALSFHAFAKARGKYKDLLYEVGNIPRSVMASADVSGVGRQGLGALTNHPIISSRVLGDMMRSFGSEEAFQREMTALAQRPNAPMYHVGGLQVTNLEEIGNREEAFASNLAEKLTGLGNRNRSFVRWSGRAYTLFLSKARADIFDYYVAQFAKTGTNVHDQEFLKGLGAMVNSITGRGWSLGGLARNESGKALNTVLFSPRLMASRFDMFNPVYYAKMPRKLRLLALRHSLVTVGAIMTTLELARLSGAKVGVDPRSADFAKIKVGNTRIDVAAGYQQVVRVLAQIIVGQSVSSSTGEVVNLRSGKYGQKTTTDVLTTFFQNKESPLFSVGSDYLLRGGQNSIGQKVTPQSEAYQHLSPLLIQDVRDIYNEKHGGMNGIAWAVGAYGLGALGVGLQTYATPPPKALKKPQSYFGSSSSGGGSPYFAPAPASSSGGYFK